MHEGLELGDFSYQFLSVRRLFCSHVFTPLLRLLSNTKRDDFLCPRVSYSTYLLAQEMPLEEGQAKLSVDRVVCVRSYSIISQKQLPPHAPCLAQLSVDHVSGISDRTVTALLPQAKACSTWS